MLFFFVVVDFYNYCNSFSLCDATQEKGRREEEIRRLNDLPVLATCWSGALEMLFSKVNLTKALDNNRYG